MKKMPMHDEKSMMNMNKKNVTKVKVKDSPEPKVKNCGMGGMNHK